MVDGGRRHRPVPAPVPHSSRVTRALLLETINDSEFRRLRFALAGLDERLPTRALLTQLRQSNDLKYLKGLLGAGRWLDEIVDVPRGA